MANRYWVGGTATWDNTAGTKWSATSGGAGGASVPTSADDVYFDAASGAVTVTLSVGSPVLAKSLNFTGFSGTFTGLGQVTVSGNVTLVTGMTYTHTGIVSIAGTGTLISAGKTLAQLSINSVGITVTLGDALTLSNSITLIAGTFNTADYSITTVNFTTSGSSTKVLNLGSSTVTVSSNFDLRSNTGLTVNTGTSNIVLTNSTGSFYGGPEGGEGATFYNVSFTSITGGTTRTIYSRNTFNNLSIARPSSAGISTFTFTDSQVINGTLSITGTINATCRVLLRSQNYGIAQTLTINNSASLTDADFRDIYIIGSAAPITGTRIGDAGGCTGITFTTAKNVYYEGASTGTGLWTANDWAASPGGATSLDNFPLPQDTALFYRNYGTRTIQLHWPLTPSINCTGGTITLGRPSASPFRDSQAFYGAELTLSSGASFDTTSTTMVFAPRNKICKIITVGKNIPFDIAIDCFNGGVELADAYAANGRTITVTSGTFDTKSYTLNLGIGGGRLQTSGTLPKTINLGNSGITCSILNIGSNLTDNATLNAGTSQLNINAGNNGITWNGHTYYNVRILSGNGFKSAVGTAVINNLTVDGPTGTSSDTLTFSGNLTIQGTLTIGSSSSVINRILVCSNTIGTVRTLTANVLNAQNVDFRDITIAGAAANTFAPGCGDCTGNTGIIFPAPKTVYWNLSGTQSWSANAWASTSGGTTNINNFPLAQDTAVFNDSGSAGTVTLNFGWHLGALDFSTRTLPITFSSSSVAASIYKDITYSSSVTLSSGGGTITFSGNNLQLVNQNGASGDWGLLALNKPVNSEVKLTSALTNTTRSLTATSGTFNADTYNVTVGAVSAANATSGLKMGSGTWTITGTSVCWNLNSVLAVFEAGTADIVLSNNTTSARTFTSAGSGANGLSYNKLTIGGNTSTSTTTISGNNFFTELASTKTVAHTIDLGTTIQTFGKWSVTGTAGNIVTVTGTGIDHIIAGPRVEGVDYLAMGSIGFATAASNPSAGEFYAGANSTGTNATIIKTVAPAARTLYWVGGTGNWSDTAKWSLQSGGSGGQAIPTSVDDVVFNSNSNATSYTLTMNTLARCKSFTMSGPATGTVTWAGVSSLIAHGNFTLAATGIIRSFSGDHFIVLSGAPGSSNSFTTNGVALASGATFSTNLILAGYNATWNQQSAILLGTINRQGSLYIRTGTYNSNDYDMGSLGFISVDEWPCVLNLGSSTITLRNTNPIIHNKSSPAISRNFTFNAGTSTITFSSMTSSLWRGPIQFYNITYEVQGSGIESGFPITFGTGTETYNNLTIARVSGAGYTTVNLRNNITVNGSLIFSGTINPLRRVFIRSNTIGTQIALTCNSFQNLTDVDFRDINLVSQSGPVSGTRLGDVKGNTGIIFASPKTVYWASSTGNQWMPAATPALWATAPGGPRALENHPLPQDIAVINDSSPASGEAINLAAGSTGDLIIPTLDLSQRTLPININTAVNNVLITGNLIYSNSATLATAPTFRLIGRNQQYITSAGKQICNTLRIDSPGGEVILLDSLLNASLIITAGIFNANGYNVTTPTVNAGTITSSTTISTGTGTWTITGNSGTVWSAASNLIILGTANLSFTGTGSKTFAGSSLNYSGITINHGGPSTLSITGNNTLKNITNTYKSTGATIINLGSTTQRVEQFTASGEAGRLLTIQGTSGTSPATLILTGSAKPNSDYLTVSNVRAYPLTDTWYAGTNSVNSGSLGFSFTQAPAAPTSNQNFLMFFN